MFILLHNTAPSAGHPGDAGDDESGLRPRQHEANIYDQAVLEGVATTFP